MLPHQGLAAGRAKSIGQAAPQIESAPLRPQQIAGQRSVDALAEDAKLPAQFGRLSPGHFLPETVSASLRAPDRRHNRTRPRRQKSNAFALEHLDDVAREINRDGAIKDFKEIDVRTDKDLAKQYKRGRG